MMKFSRGAALRPVAIAALMGCVALPAMADELFYVMGGVGNQAENFKTIVKPWEERTGHTVTLVPMPNSSSDQFAQYRLWLAAGTTLGSLHQWLHNTYGGEIEQHGLVDGKSVVASWFDRQRKTEIEPMESW